ncbi:MAG: LacI family transcriptional regulator [Ruminococcus sp.]|jgi:DNA-binding LacI/PurR family transcriptional regulator|nr:LacI family transcriptional regulator [Ruminococcus sp.]
MPTIKDIAAACGVSIATVSKALNGHDDVAEKTKNLVKNAAREMGYTPNSQAQALKTNKTYNLGVLFSDNAGRGLTHTYFSQVLDGFKVYVEKYGYDVTFIGPRFGNRRLTYLEHAKTRGFDGICIVCVDSFEEPMIKELSLGGYPIVTVDYAYPGFPAVLSDNKAGMRTLVNYAYSMGHKKIAYIYGDKSDVTSERVAAYLETLEELGVDVNPSYLVEGLYIQTEVTEALTAKLLNLANPPTCIIMPDDFAAMGGLNAIGKRGLKVPEDISIIGYDGVKLSEVIRPPLTTFRQDAHKIGAEAAKRLISDIKKEPHAARVLTVSGEIIHGESVGPVKV